MPRLKVVLRVFCLLLMLGLARPGHAGTVGGTMARYMIGGAGIGAVIGALGATIPYLNDKQPFDFAVGAGAGVLGGVSIGLIAGIIDLSTAKDDDSGPNENAYLKPVENLYAFRYGNNACLGYHCTF